MAVNDVPPWELQSATDAPIQGQSPDVHDTAPWDHVSVDLAPQDWISKLYHPAIIGAGMSTGGGIGALLGGAAGIETGPGAAVTSAAGGIAGAAAMYGPSKNAANAIDAMRGMQAGSPTGDINQDFGTGMEYEAGGKVLTGAIKLASPALRSGIIKGISTVFGPSKEAIEAWLENPSLPKSADFEALARRLPQTLNNLKGLITHAKYQADTFLSNSVDPAEGAIPKQKVLGLLNSELDKLATPGIGVVGAENQAAKSRLENLRDLISSFKGDHLPQSTVKGLINSQEPGINFADRTASPLNNALVNFTSGANKLLKDNNLPYKNAMKEVSHMMGTLEDTMSDFGVENPVGKGLQPTKQTITKLQSITKESNAFTRDTLTDLTRLTGDDYLEHATKAKYAAEFQKGATQGSRRVLLGSRIGGTVGAGIGGAAGHPMIGAEIGQSIGSGFGAVADKYGGPMAGVTANLIKSLSAHIPTELATRIVVNALMPQTQAQEPEQQE